MTAAPGANRAAGPSSVLNELSQALRAIHKTLLDAELDNFPMARGTGDQLKLVIEHPSFAWLHALSELIVEIDELADAGDITAATLRQSRDAVERLLGPLPALHADFRARYLEYLQLVPDVAVTAGAVRRLLADIGKSVQSGS